MAEKKIGRRTFIKRAAAGVAASSVFGPVYAQTARRVRWRMATSWPKSLDTIYGAAELLGRRAAELTGGRFTIEVHPGGELTKPLEVLQAVQKGTVEIGHTAVYYYTKLHPAFAFPTALPFGLTARQQNAWLDQGGGNDLLNKELFDAYGVLGLPAGNTSLQMGGWFRFPVDRATDFRGLRMRIPGLGGEVLRRIGVKTVTLPASEILPALESGRIDATEWVGPYDDEKLGFYKVATFYYYPGWWEPGTTLHAVVNRRAYAKLPREYQEALVSASREANAWALAAYDQKNPEALARLLSYGVQLRPFPRDFLKLVFREAENLYAELAAKDATYRKIFEHWNKARTLLFRWFSTNEASYADFTFRLF